MRPGAPVVAFLDASVLYPALLRNVAMYFAGARLYRPLWSDAVHAEWTAALRRDRPDLDGRAIERTRWLMTTHVPDATVREYEALVSEIVLPDPDDRHVLAAAIHGGAGVIVTANLRDFPMRRTRPYGISVQHPDRFFDAIATRQPLRACAALRELRLALKAPPFTVTELLQALERQGLRTTAAGLRSRIDLL